MPDTREKLIEFTVKHQQEADKLSGAAKTACGDDRTVSVYKWMHSLAAAHKEFVAELDDIATLLENGVTVQELDGCEYCKQFDDPFDAPMIAKEDYEPDRGIYLYNGFLCANGGEFVVAKVNFCPMCGRKLPEPPKGE